MFVGTESVGLLRSNDSGASWQPVESAVLSGGNAAPLAVTALATDPGDEQIMYAATGIWLGTSTTRLTSLGVAVSVDGGQQWIQMSTAGLSDPPVQRLEPVAGRPLAVLAVNSAGSNVVALKMSPELSALLQSDNPAVRASAARAIELIGDPATQATMYRYIGHQDGTTAMQRSPDGGITWLAAGALPKQVAQLAVNPADDAAGFARIGASLWRNGSSDVSWAGIDSLPGQPLASGIRRQQQSLGTHLRRHRYARTLYEPGRRYNLAGCRRLAVSLRGRISRRDRPRRKPRGSACGLRGRHLHDGSSFGAA